MPYLPSKRLLWLLAGAAPLFVIDAGLGLAADAVIIAAAVVDAALCPDRRTLRVRRELPPRVSLDASFAVRFHVETDAGWPVRVRLTDDLPPAFERTDETHFADSVTYSAGRQGHLSQGRGRREAPGEGRGGTPPHPNPLPRPGERRAEMRHRNSENVYFVIEALVPARRDVVVEYRAIARGRGERYAGDVHVRALGRLGLVWRQRRDRCDDAVLVQPGLSEVERYRSLALHHHSREVGLHSVRLLRGEGSSFESLREYVPGDDPRYMDWKSTARRGKYMVRQYEAERSQNVLLAIDAGRLMTERIGGRVRLDHALAAALLLADVARLHGDRVGLFVFADRIQQFLPPSHISLARIAAALGRVEERGAESDYPAAFTHLGKRLRRRSLLVVFTDIVDARTSAALLAHLGTAARRHLPLAVTLRNTELEAAAEAAARGDAGVYRRAAAEELILARAGAIAAMQRAGILVADTRPHAAITTVVNRYLDVKRRGLL